MVDIFFYSTVLKFQCKLCRESIILSDLHGILWEEVDYINTIVDDSFLTHIDIETPASALWWGDFGRGGAGAVCINYTLRATICKCETNHTFKLYINFLAEIPDWDKGKRTTYLEVIEDILALGSDTMTFTSDFLILKGEEILNIIHFLFRRWAALGYRMEIFCPYISIETCWNPLLQIASEFTSAHHKIAPISIYTRKLQEFRKFNLEQQIARWINDEKLTGCNINYEIEEPPCDDDPFHPCIHNFGKFVTSEVYYTKINFHAKYYAGYTKGHSEIAHTSFNLIHYELNQYETFKLTTMLGLDLNSIRPNLEWERFVLNEEILRTEAVEYYFDDKKVKAYFKSKDCRVSSNLIQGSKLNLIIERILDKAVYRAKENDRETVESIDI